MFYVTRCLEDDNDVFRAVEEAFGDVFDGFDRVKGLASKWGVDSTHRGRPARPRYSATSSTSLRKYRGRCGEMYGVSNEHSRIRRTWRGLMRSKSATSPGSMNS